MTTSDGNPPRLATRALLGTGVVALILSTVHFGAPDSWVATAAAAAMLLLPWALMPRDPGPALMGDWRRDGRHLLLWSLGTFLPFALLFHFWFSAVLGFTLSPELSTSRISRFQPDLRANHKEMLSPVHPPSAEVRMWEKDRSIFVFVPRNSPTVQVDIRPDNHATAAPPTERRLLRGRLRKDHTTGPPTSWAPRELTPGHGFSFPAKSAEHIKISNPGKEPWRLNTPFDSSPISAGTIETIPRNLIWIPMMFLLHLVAVALPEEYFFRGFLQRVLRDKLPKIKVPFLPGAFPLAIVVSSLLFALVHMAAVPHFNRLAVFFPSLLFGWLYERSGNLSQPIAYHALSNVVLAVYEMIWFG